jgi:RNA-directed DNA polymerase
MPNPSLAAVLTRSILAGEATVESIAARAGRTLGRDWRWLAALGGRYVAQFANGTRPRHRDVVRFLLADSGFQRALTRYSREIAVAQWVAEDQQMQPVASAAAWNLPAISSAGELAEWLALSPEEMEWFADLKALGYKETCPRLRHYHYRILMKRSGSVRLIEAPKPRLKQLQRLILTGILERIPSHPAAHGCIKGRSIETFVAPHVGQRVVLRMDLRDFFPTFGGARIQSFFRTAGYPESVADLLGGICTNAAPRDVWHAPAFDADPHSVREARELYSRPHLPQGAPTSPALANLCTYRVDCRLTGLAKSAGAAYTRYVDDLAFSGGDSFARRVERFSLHVAAILHEEGLQVRHRKTRIMRQGVRQHLAGLVANERVSVIRADFDRLKATLTNCVRRGPEGQNRHGHAVFRSHLEGRVGFVEMINPQKGKRLRAIFDEIRWE